MLSTDRRLLELAGIVDAVDEPLQAGRRRLLLELLDRGYSCEELLEAHAQDRLTVLMLEEVFRESAFLTARDVAQRSGLEVAEVLRASRLLGLPVGSEDTPAYDEAGCTALQTLRLARESGLSAETTDEIMVVLGRHLWQLAADIEVLIGNELGRAGDTEYELAHRYADAARVLAPAAAPVVAGVFLAHLRERMRDIFVTPMEAELGGLRAVADVAVAFVDVVGFTELGERVGAGELKSIAARLAAIGDQVVERPVRMVKSIGDAILLMSRETGPLVDALVALHTVADDDPTLPAVHSGVAYGQAHVGGADVYGAPVNRASRLTDLAPPGEIWAEAAVIAQGPPGCERWRSIGLHAVKGCGEPIDIYRFSPTDDLP